MNYKDFFKNKKIAVIGLGSHGEMVTDIKFLLRNKVDLKLFDLRSQKRFEGFLPVLKDLGLKEYIFGKVDSDELLNFDLIILSPEISKRSLFLKKATQAEKQIEYPDTLFFKLSPPITLIGVLGLYGKTTVAHMIHSVLKKSFVEYRNQGLFFMDPESNYGALNHLKKIKKNDVVLVRIPEYLMCHYHEIHISPQVAVITSLIPFDILDFQTYNNFIIAPDEVIDAIKKEKNFPSKAKMLRTRAGMIPTEWGIDNKILHNKENAALVLQTSELFKVSTDLVREVIQVPSVMKGRVEFVKKVSGIEFYNDSSSITAKSTLSALRSLSSGKNIILILGGAYTGHDYTDLIKNVAQYTSSVILLPGSGTLGIRSSLEALEGINLIQVPSLEDAVKEAHKGVKKGERVLFSPAFDALGVDISRKERGEKFVKFVRGL